MDNLTNNQIYIQDYIVRSVNKDITIEQIVSDDSRQSIQLYQQISILIDEVSQIHQKNHCIGPNLAIKKESENHLSRLVTTEFMFYTQKRLKVDEFCSLFSDILDLAKKQPENLHLILSSFAVEALNQKTMNVVVFIICGKNPRIEFIVKNNAHLVDPMYCIIENEEIDHFGNINVLFDKEEVFPILTIQGKQYHFSYNNIFEITTFGGAKKIMAVEICLDHLYALAKTNCIEYVESGLAYPLRIFPNQMSQVISSNSVALDEDKMLEDNATHADTRIPAQKCKPHSHIVEEKNISPIFGKDALHCILIDSTPCSKFKKNLLTQIENYNERRYVFVHPANHNFYERFNNTLVQGYQLFSDTFNKTSETIHNLYNNFVDNSSKKRTISHKDNQYSPPKKRNKTQR